MAGDGLYYRSRQRESLSQVAAINHPADSGPDMSRADELPALTERPVYIKRLIDFRHATLD